MCNICKIFYFFLIFNTERTAHLEGLKFVTVCPFRFTCLVSARNAVLGTHFPDQPPRPLLAQLSCIKNASNAPAVGPGLPAGAVTSSPQSDD